MEKKKNTFICDQQLIFERDFPYIPCVEGDTNGGFFIAFLMLRYKRSSSSSKSFSKFLVPMLVIKMMRDQVEVNHTMEVNHTGNPLVGAYDDVFTTQTGCGVSTTLKNVTGIKHDVQTLEHVLSNLQMHFFVFFRLEKIL